MKTLTGRFIFFSCLLAFLLGGVIANAAKRDADEPIRIKARHVEANDKNGTVVYSGDVVVEQGNLSIRADRLEVRTRQGKTELVRATGKPVKLHRAPGTDVSEIRAEAGRVDYHFSQNKIDLFGQVKVQQGEDLYSADVVHYDLESKNLSASGDEDGNGRVHAVIQPEKNTAGTQPRP